MEYANNGEFEEYGNIRNMRKLRIENHSIDHAGMQDTLVNKTAYKKIEILT